MVKILLYEAVFLQIIESDVLGKKLPQEQNNNADYNVVIERSVNKPQTRMHKYNFSLAQM